MRRVCQLFIGAFLAAYGLALLVFAAGTFGWFGATPDPLSGIFLVPLGLPWNLLVDHFPEPLWPWLAAMAPALNLVLVRVACGRCLRRR